MGQENLHIFMADFACSKSWRESGVPPQYLMDPLVSSPQVQWLIDETKLGLGFSTAGMSSCSAEEKSQGLFRIGATMSERFSKCPQTVIVEKLLMPKCSNKLLSSFYVPEVVEMHLLTTPQCVAAYGFIYGFAKFPREVQELIVHWLAIGLTQSGNALMNVASWFTGCPYKLEWKVWSNGIDWVVNDIPLKLAQLPLKFNEHTLEILRVFLFDDHLETFMEARIYLREALASYQKSLDNSSALIPFQICQSIESLVHVFSHSESWDRLMKVLNVDKNIIARIKSLRNKPAHGRVVDIESVFWSSQVVRHVARELISRTINLILSCRETESSP
jgi:hypothetical protein